MAKAKKRGLSNKPRTYGRSAGSVEQERLLIVYDLAGATICQTQVPSCFCGLEVKQRLAELLVDFPAVSQQLVMRRSQGRAVLYDLDMISDFLEHEQSIVEVTLLRLQPSIVDWLILVRQDSRTPIAHSFTNAHADIQNCFECVLEDVSRDGALLSCVGPEFRSDSRIALAAVKHCGASLEFVADGAATNDEVVLAALSNDGLALRHALPRFQQDRRMVLAAVAQNSTAIKYADKKLRYDCIIRCAMLSRCLASCLPAFNLKRIESVCRICGEICGYAGLMVFGIALFLVIVAVVILALLAVIWLSSDTGTRRLLTDISALTTYDSAGMADIPGWSSVHVLFRGITLFTVPP